MCKIRAKYLSILFLALLLSISCAPSGGDEKGVSDPPAGTEEEAAEAEPEGDPYATVITDEGEIEIRLRPDLAPKTVESFIGLARSGFYYNTLFHRVIAGTMIQGGDPNSKDNNPYNDGQGNSGSFLTAEFSQAPFERGTVAMARQPGDPNSASCQFFICLKRMRQWDGEYTVFGEVVQGLDVVDKISKSPTSKQSRLEQRPAGNIRIKRVKIDYR